jgi:tRNA-2-methylthio-N6-dimethylallyladenosine synthase
VRTPRKVWMETYGCQMNKAESESLLIDLARDGWVEADHEEEADLVIINTCSVRATAEERIQGRLGFFRHEKKRRSFTLVLTGCMAERLKGRILDEHPEVDVVVGNFSKDRLIPAILSAELRRTSTVMADPGGYSFAGMHSREGVKAFVPIMHGCNNWCSYCIVPRVRGPEVSRSPQEIIAELRLLDRRGTREVTLLGQNVNSYRWQGGEGTLPFPGLLRMAAREVESIRWMRFLTSHPKDLSEELIEVIAGNPLLCRHVHLPLQSGSTRILRLMNRGYTAEAYESLVRRIRAALTGVAITTDILIGFPGETESDFQQTLECVERVGFDDAFTYHYNPREGTAAYAMPDPVPHEVQTDRLSRLIEEQRRIGMAKARERIGSEATILVEGVSKRDPGELLARTEWDAMAVFPGPRSRIGQFVTVRLTDLSGTTFRAEPL